jgi:hypothetical protein
MEAAFSSSKRLKKSNVSAELEQGVMHRKIDPEAGAVLCNSSLQGMFKRFFSFCFNMKLSDVLLCWRNTTSIVIVYFLRVLQISSCVQLIITYTQLMSVVLAVLRNLLLYCGHNLTTEHYRVSKTFCI